MRKNDSLSPVAPRRKRSRRSRVARGLAAALVVCFAAPVPAGLPGGCPAPLDEETLAALVLRSFAPSVTPGGTSPFTLGVFECCVFLRRIDACVAWTVEPAGAATLELTDPAAGEFEPSGRLHVEATASHGTVITLSADVEEGRRQLAFSFHVYTPEENPLVGYWAEEESLPCPSFVRGDQDQDGEISITDAIKIFGYLFLGEERPTCLEASNTNGDEDLDISDGIALLGHLFLGGTPPAWPFPDCARVRQPIPHPCGSSARCPSVVPPDAAVINELVFEADGTFRVTWIPFELYVDYWGEYEFDLAGGTLRLEVTGGNYVPDDFRAAVSSFSIAPRRLELRDTWLGSPSFGTSADGCGHVFTR